MTKIVTRVKNFGGVLKNTFTQWIAREPFNNSIIIAYYTIFSLPGLLVIVINIAGYFFDKKDVTGQITGQIQAMIGGDTAKDIESIVAKASEGKDTVISSIIAIATLLFGATGVFYQVQQMLNKIWEVKPRPKEKILKLVKDRIFSFGLILIVGFLLLVSLALSAALSVVSAWVSVHFSESLDILFRAIDISISIGVITILFALIFKFLPDAKIAWRDVWHGALLTSVLFVITKFALGLYFGNSDPGSTYGAAGSIILIMLWVSYVGLILLYGAEFTKVYSVRKGKKIIPTEAAMSTKGDPDNGAILHKRKQKVIANT